MKNRMLKGAHLSERKCREIIQFFCEDLTATQIAEHTGVSRVTINAYLKMIRIKLAEYCDKLYPANEFPKNHYHLTGDKIGMPRTHFFGFTRYNGQIFSTGLVDLSRDHISEWQQQVDQAEHPMHAIHAIADFSNWRLFRRELNYQQNSKSIADDISGFWGLTRNRLLKFRGLNRNTLYLHIKECEFRYNHRFGNMQMLLLQMINREPLNGHAAHLPKKELVTKREAEKV